MSDIATLGIRIDARQVREADGALDRLATTGARTEQSVNGVNDAMARMQRLAAQVTAALGVAEIVRMADAWSNLQGQLSLVVDGQERLAQTSNKLYAMAQQTRQGLKETVDLYTKIQRSTEALNKTDADRMRVTETINKSLVISHASTQAASQALMQLGQAFSMGQLRGEELNSVLEQTPGLARAIAEGMGKTTGELKVMGAAGKLTAESVFNALERSSSAVDAEFAKLPTTVGQATTQIQNALLRTVGVFDQTNGLSHSLASTLTVLSENMGTVVSAVGTLIAVKLVNWLQDAAVGLYNKVAAIEAAIVAERAETAAALANAEAQVARATTTAAAATIVRAMTIDEVAHTAALARETVALEALTVAQRSQAAAASVAGNVAGWGARALGLLGGPLGLITLALGVGATAWSMYGNKAAEAVDKAEKSLSEKHAEIIADLDKQIAKLTERNRLMSIAPAVAKSQAPGGDDQRAILTEINRVSKDASLTDVARTEILRVLGGQYNEVTVRMAAYEVQQNKLTAATNGDKFKDWMQKHTEYLDKAGKIAAAIADAKKELGDAFEPNKDAVTKLITDAANKSDVQKTVSAYQTLITSIREKTAENRIEAAVGRDATEAQKERIKVDTELASGKLKLTAANKASVIAALAELDASEKAARTAQAVRDLAKAHDEAAIAQQAAAAGLAVEYASYGKIADVRELDLIAVKNETEAQRQLLEWQYKGVTVTDAMAASLKADTAERTKNERAIAGQQKALAYADQLRQANQQFTVDYTIDPKAKAAAQLAIEKAMWQSRISLADEGTKARELIESEYTVWLRDQQIKPQLDAEIAMWQSIDSTAHDTFVSIMNGGKDMATRLRDTLKNVLFAWLYEMTLKKWIVQVEAQVVGSQSTAGGMGDVFSSAASSSANPAISALGKASQLYNSAKAGLSSLSSSGIAGSLGSGISSMGSQFGSGAVANFGKGMQGFGADGSLGQAAGYGQAAGAAVNALGGLAGGHMLGNMISGGYSVGDHGQAMVNTGAAIGAAIGSIVPVLGTFLGGIVGGALGGLANRVFGHKAPEIESQGLRGTYGANGLTGETYQNIVEKGGWLSSDKHRNDRQDLDAGMTSQLSQAFTSIKDVSGNFAKSLGVNADALANYSKTFDIAFTSDQAKNQTAIEDFFKTVGDEVATILVPNLAAFKQSGESAAATLERLAGEFEATTQAATNLGGSVDAMFGSAGLDGAAARERLVQLAGGTNALLSLTGDFAKNFMTDAERLAPVSSALDKAFTSLGVTTIPQTEAQYKALVQSIKPTNEANAELLVGLLQLGDAFTQIHKAADEVAKADIDNAFAAVEKAIDREKDLRQKAHDAEVAGITAASDAAKKSLQNFKDLASVLHSTLDTMAQADTDPVNAARARAAAMAKVQGSLAIAKAGGPLPLAADLKDALSTLGKDSKDQYGDATSYKRDQALAAIAVSKLADLTDGKVDSTQAQIDRLDALRTAVDDAYDGQIKMLDEQLQAARDAIDIARDTYVATLDVTDAIHSLMALMGPSGAISAAYATALGRAPDAAGGAYWNKQVADGMDVNTAVDYINNSPEAKVRELYKSVLGRTADAGGLSFWLDAINNGATIDSVRDEFLNSPEYRNTPHLTAAPASMTTMGTSTAADTTAAINLALQKIASNTMRTANAAEDTNRATLEAA